MKSFKTFLNAKTRTPQEIAQHHKIDVDFIHSQLKMGMRVGHEHTKHEGVAREIALDHLWEDPHYYSKLDKAGL